MEAERFKELLSDDGFARRVDAELDALGYPQGHFLRIAAQARFKKSGPQQGAERCRIE